MSGGLGSFASTLTHTRICGTCDTGDGTDGTGDGTGMILVVILIMVMIL